MRTATLLSVALATAASASPIAKTRRGEVLEGQYIVSLKPTYGFVERDLDATIGDILGSLDSTLVARDGSSIFQKYDFGGSATFQGFAAKLPAEAVEAIKSHPEVDAIEPDTIVTLEGEQTGLPSGLWGLDVLDGTKNSRYSYPEQAGQGVDAFIIDTGITVTHSDFGGRAKWGGDFTGEGQKDGNGHGTHVAGTVGGNTYGVAKKVNLIAVKVLTSSGSGSNSGVIAGMNYVAKECQGRQRKCVANMSLGGGKSSATDNAARSMINAGVALAVAAGNSAGNACNLSPAGVAEAFTVAASDVNNKLASFSERGPCVDIIAPGVNILSAWYTGSTNTISGTSMATPHVAGALAVAYSQNDFSSPSAAFAHLVSKAKTGAISGVPSNTVNKFLQI